jgi:hypothetical protein
MNGDKSHPMILRVTDIDVAYFVYARPVWTLQRCRRGWPAIAAAARLSRASDRGHPPASHFDAPDTVVFGIDKQDIVLGVDGDLFRTVKGGLKRRPMITSVALFSSPSNGSDDPVRMSTFRTLWSFRRQM